MLEFFFHAGDATDAQQLGGTGAYNANGNAPYTPTHLLAHSSTSSRVISIYDIQDPSNIVQTASTSGSYQAATGYTNFNTVVVKDTTAYVASNTANGIVSFDVSNPNDLTGSFLDSLTDVIPGSDLYSAKHIFAHPTKDILWLYNDSSARVVTIDISNPAAMSVIGTSTPSGSTNYFSTCSWDGEHFFITNAVSPLTLQRFDLTASNSPTLGATYNYGSSTGMSSSQASCFATSENTGNNFVVTLGQGGYSHFVELGPDYVADSEQQEYSVNDYDDVDVVIHSNYLDNYDASLDLALFYFAEDDSALRLLTYDASTNDVVQRVSTIDTVKYDDCGMDLHEQYIYTFSDNLDTMTVHEWTAIDSITVIGSYNGDGADNPVNIVLFRP